MPLDNPRKNKTPLYGQFTVQGFLAVSMWALVFWLQSVGMVYGMQSDGWFYLGNFWAVCWKTYATLWGILFLFMCLLPKLKDQFI